MRTRLMQRERQKRKRVAASGCPWLRPITRIGQQTGPVPRSMQAQHLRCASAINTLAVKELLDTKPTVMKEPVPRSTSVHSRLLFLMNPIRLPTFHPRAPVSESSTPICELILRLRHNHPWLGAGAWCWGTVPGVGAGACCRGLFAGAWRWGLVLTASLLRSGSWGGAVPAARNPALNPLHRALAGNVTLTSLIATPAGGAAEGLCLPHLQKKEANPNPRRCDSAHFAAVASARQWHRGSSTRPACASFSPPPPPRPGSPALARLPPAPAAAPSAP
jgi:hypothetical protein